QRPGRFLRRRGRAMGRGPFAPHRIRARYAKALNEIPLPVRSFTGIDPDSLAILGEVQIDDRLVRIGILYAIPRLWIVLPEHVPPMLGFVNGMGTGRTDLHVTEPDHLEWSRRPG
ncbi:hypothetical protein ADL26_17920, partial [Thermoactinomyces vulgaris]